MLLGLVLIVPLIWALGVLSELHRAALATTAAAREAGFDAARAASPADAERRVDAAVVAALTDHGLDPRAAAVVAALTDHGLDPRAAAVTASAAGLERGSAVEVRVVYEVPVLQAPFLGSVGGPSIEVTATHVTRVDPYRSRP
jgi:Na+-transporting methylmalonyl-CoA/oxaloacetate decarboxylase gamma subunit